MTRRCRLLCTLLIVLLALPAMQARACAPEPVAAHHMGHDMTAAAHHAGMAHGAAGHEAPAPTAPHHDCIGCIAPIDRAFYRPVSAPAAGPSLHAEAMPPPLGLDHSRPPEPPPPRAHV